MTKPRRTLRNEELDALRICILNSDPLAEKEHWESMGKPDVHVWTMLNTLIEFYNGSGVIDTIGPFLTMSERPQYASVGRFDQEPILKGE